MEVVFVRFAQIQNAIKVRNNKLRERFKLMQVETWNSKLNQSFHFHQSILLLKLKFFRRLILSTIITPLPAQPTIMLCLEKCSLTLILRNNYAQSETKNEIHHSAWHSTILKRKTHIRCYQLTIYFQV